MKRRRATNPNLPTRLGAWVAARLRDRWLTVALALISLLLGLKAWQALRDLIRVFQSFNG